MAHFNQPQKNPPWVRNNVQQQPILAQQMTVQSVALSQPTLATTHIAPQNSIGQVQITPAIQGHQVQLPLAQTHLVLNQPLANAFGQVQINQTQLANIATSQHQASTHQTYFTPSISLQQGTIQIQPSSLVIPSSVATSIAPPGLAISTTLATVHPNTTATYTLNRLAVAPPQLHQLQQGPQQPQQQLQQQQLQQQQLQQHQLQQQQLQQQQLQQQQLQQQQLQQQQLQQQPPQQPTVKQRVFSGLITKLHENFGFIDEEVIFQSTVVKGTNPQVGDRVLVEASYNGSMPFKWNATRVQVIAQTSTQKVTSTLAISDVSKQMNRDWTHRSRNSAGSDYRDSDRSTPKTRESRRRASRSSSQSPSRKRSRSPHGSPRRRSRTAPRYSVQIPKVSLDCREANLIELRRRYSHMYVPSDFLSSTHLWLDSFPMQRPFPLGKAVSFHVFDKDIDPPIENDAIFEPADADYAYSAKVMLASLPSMDDMMRQCCPEEDRDDFVHPARLVRFLVGHRGKNETMAIGGPWSPSLDGADPDKDPQVLIRTAIRTCKALTGIDLAPCARWYRVAEVRYRRVSSGKDRIETVLLLVPDVWSCLPTAGQWEETVRSYVQPYGEDQSKVVEDDQANVKSDEEQGKSATHFSKINLKNLKMEELRSELEARNLNSQGDRWQLVARLTIATRSEADDERCKKEQSVSTDEGSPDQSPSHTDQSDDHHKMDFAASPRILVHPSRSFKGGKFTCSVVSLSVLLDYRPEDTKEHTFEVSLFSELFNEMLMRDFGALVYRSVLNEAQRKDKKKEDDDSDKSKKKPMKDRRLAIHTNVPPLLAYCYFDLSHCNYIASKDLEDLFLTLGLQLSRAQARKLLQKVTLDDSLRYRKLVEKTGVKDADIEDQDSQPSNAQCSHESSAEDLSNGKDCSLIENGQSNVTLVNGCYVNIEQLVARLEQSEESRRETQSQLKLVQQQLGTYRSDLSKAEETISSLYEQLSNEKLKNETSTDQLIKLQDCVNKYSEAIGKIHKITNNLSTASRHVKKEDNQTNDQLD